MYGKESRNLGDVMREVELINKRRPREKQFLREDGSIVAKIYNKDVHYNKKGKYEEIDNTLIKEKDGYSNKSNSYKVFFKEETEDSLMKMSKDDNYLDIKLKKCNKTKINKKERTNKLREDITYNNVLEGVDIEYQTLSNKVKETIVLKNNKYKKLEFIVDTNLSLELKENYIIAKKQRGVVRCLLLAVMPGKY